MEILKHLKVPTGDILVVNGNHGKLEMLSLGDYGQAVNLNQDKSVPDGLPLLPLTEKWVVTVSTQYGCSMNCKFCDVPKVGFGRNASLDDLRSQILTALTLPGVPNWTGRLNVHFARMGEPTWNPAVLECGRWLEGLTSYNPHPVVSTMMPKKNGKLREFIVDWMKIKNGIYSGNAGLQLSINSTNEGERREMFSGNACTLEEISTIMQGIKPVGRKITLNFAVADYTVDPDVLLKYFDPQHYIIKLTPMHKTATAVESNIVTQGNYTTPEPYIMLRDELKRAGYDVLVFIASRDEDEGRITCGNAILSGTLPSKYEIIKEAL
jgi:23S rRNA (adenine2503-C2)-methyltransferase